MESSLASTSSPPHRHNHHLNPTQPLIERVLRALGHHLRLLHRSDSNFFVLGATGNVYTVTLSLTPSCTCPDRTTPCKHMLFVYIRVLGLPLDDTCLWRKTLRPCQLIRLLSMPTSDETMAGVVTRERFHELFFRASQGGAGSSQQQVVTLEDGAMCPVCLEEMGRVDKVVACATCKNPIHKECLLAWKRSSRRRSTSCVICRARWKDRVDQEMYLNLSAYVNEDEMAVDQGAGYCGDNSAFLG